MLGLGFLYGGWNLSKFTNVLRESVIKIAETETSTTGCFITSRSGLKHSLCLKLMDEAVA